MSFSSQPLKSVLSCQNKTDSFKLTSAPGSLKVNSSLNHLNSANSTNTTTTNLTATTLLNGQSPWVSIEDTPNKLLYKKIETIIEKMQDSDSGGGVPIRTVKSFMSKIPSVFTGVDLIQWMLKKLDVEDTCEALHFAHLISSHGYLFPIDDHILTVKNDGTFFRFQVFI